MACIVALGANKAPKPFASWLILIVACVCAPLTMYLIPGSEVVRLLYSSAIPAANRSEIVFLAVHALLIAGCVPMWATAHIQSSALKRTRWITNRIHRALIHLITAPVFVLAAITFWMSGESILESMPLKAWVEKSALILLFNALIEEAVFRKWLLSTVAGALPTNFNARAAWTTSLLVSGLIFGGIHFHIGLSTGILATLFGVLNGIVMYKTGSFSACVISHMLFNLIVARWI